MVKKKVKKSSLVSSKLDQIIELQRKQLRGQNKIEDLELKELHGQELEDQELHELEGQEKYILDQVEKLEAVEKQIRIDVGEHPLRKITYKDVGKSMVGAFVGLLSHYAVLEGVLFAHEISIARASFMYLVSLLIGLVVLYYTGFRKIKDIKVLSLLPLRLAIIYGVTLLTIIMVLFIIGKLDGLNFIEIYKTVAALSMPAIIGAAVADLIGGD